MSLLWCPWQRSPPGLPPLSLQCHLRGAYKQSRNPLPDWPAPSIWVCGGSDPCQPGEKEKSLPLKQKCLGCLSCLLLCECITTIHTTEIIFPSVCYLVPQFLCYFNTSCIKTFIPDMTFGISAFLYIFFLAILLFRPNSPLWQWVFNILNILQNVSKSLKQLTHLVLILLF